MKMMKRHEHDVDERGHVDLGAHAALGVALRDQASGTRGLAGRERSLGQRAHVVSLGGVALEDAVDQLGRRLVDVDRDVVQLGREVVVEPDRQDRDAQADGRRDEGLGDAAEDRADAAAALRGVGELLEGRDDAADGAEEATNGADDATVASTGRPRRRPAGSRSFTRSIVRFTASATSKAEALPGARRQARLRLSATPAPAVATGAHELLVEPHGLGQARRRLDEQRERLDVERDSARPRRYAKGRSTEMLSE